MCKFAKSSWLILLFLVMSFLIQGMAPVYAGPLKIVFLGDFSDVTKSYCVGAFNAASIAIKEINQDGGLLGQQVELLKMDAGISSKRHYELFKRITSDKAVVAVFGGASSDCLLMASKASKEVEIPYLISVGNSQKVLVENGHPYVFMFEANSWMETRGFAVFATLMPWKRFAWIGPDYSWGREVFAYFQQHFREIGSPIQWSSQQWHPLNTNDFSPYLSKILAADPDALVIASWGGDMNRIVSQAKESGLFGKMAAFGWFMSEEKGLQLPEGVWTLTRASYNFLAEKYPQTRRFGEKFYKLYGIYPSGFPVCSYDAIIAWKQAVMIAGTSDPKAVARSLKGLKFNGLRGENYIRAIDGQMNCSTYFGRLFYMPGSKSPALNSVIEIPAEKTWLPEEEVLKRRN